ncbi:MAG: hypothetical protein HKM04_00710 [Legionellales bacterium]|nr:hypothetical protein [Legionellales bacterium]
MVKKTNINNSILDDTTYESYNSDVKEEKKNEPIDDDPFVNYFSITENNPENDGFEQNESFYPDEELAQNESKYADYDEDNYLPPVRFHPGLATTTEARDNYENIYSDHLPFVTQIPIGPRAQPLTLLSWNVLESDGGNGFAASEIDESTGQIPHYYGETDDQRQARFEQIALSLANMIQNTSPDVVLLQEIEDKPGLLLDAIRLTIGAEYSIVMEEYTDFDDDGLPVTKRRAAANGGNIVLCRDATVQSHSCRKGTTRGLGGIDNLEEVITGFENIITLTNGREVRIRNCHSQFFSHTPLEHERVISAFLSENKNDNITRIVAGDFNCPVSKLPGSAPELVTSSVAAPYFTHKTDAIQHGHYIDGAYYRTAGAKTLHQAETIQYNPVTGLPFRDEEITATPENIPPQQEAIFRRFRPAMQIDNLYRATAFDDITNNEITPDQISAIDEQFVLQFESTLRLRYATNLFNQPGLCAFGLTIQETATFRALFPNFQYTVHIDPRDDEKKTFIISAPQSDSLKFIKAMNALPWIRVLPAIKQKSPQTYDAVVKLITANANSNRITFNYAAKAFEALLLLPLTLKIKASNSRLHTEIRNLIHCVCNDKEISSTQATTIFTHVHALLTPIAMNEQPNMQQIAQTKDALDKEVHYTPLMSRSSKIAIGATVGAIAGIAIFGVIVTALTLGAGILPLATLGSAIAFSIFGSGLTIGGAATGAAIANEKAKINPKLSPQYKNAYNSTVKETFKLFKPEKPKPPTEESLIIPDSSNSWSHQKMD